MIILRQTAPLITYRRHHDRCPLAPGGHLPWIKGSGAVLCQQGMRADITGKRPRMLRWISDDTCPSDERPSEIFWGLYRGL